MSTHDYEELRDWDPMQEDYANNFQSGRHKEQKLISTNDCLCVKNIPPEWGKDGVENYFSKYGSVKSVYVKSTKEPGHYTYGFVNFHSPQEALSALHKTKNNKFQLRVEMAREKTHTKTFVQSENSKRLGNHQHSANQHLSSGEEIDGNNYESGSDHMGKFVQPMSINFRGPKRSVAILPVPSTSLSENSHVHNNNNAYRQNQDCYSDESDFIESNSGHSYPNDRSAVSFIQKPGGRDETVPHAPNYNGDPCVEYAGLEEIETEPDDFECSRNSHVEYGGLKEINPCVTHRVLPTHCPHSCNAHCAGDQRCAVVSQNCCHRHLNDCKLDASQLQSAVPCRSKRCCEAVEPMVCADHSNIPVLKKNSSLCTHCGRLGDFVCTICNAPYCSRKCQEDDWPRHAVECGVSKHIGHSADQNQNHSISYNHSITDKHIIESQSASHFSTTYPLSDANSKTNVASHDRKLVHTKVHQNHQEIHNNITLNDQNRNEHVHHGNSKSVIGDKQGKPSTIPNGTNLSPPSIKENNSSIHGNNNARMLPAGTSNEKTPASSSWATRSNVSIQVLPKLKSSSITSTTLLSNVNEKVKICSLRNPNLFWVQRIEDNKILQQLEKEMSDLCNHKTSYKLPAVDDVCAVFADGKLYRCKIKKASQPGPCEVLRIDYGKVIVTRCANLYCLTSNVAAYPALAICCKLTNKNMKRWTEEYEEFFTYLVEGKELKACVVEEKFPILTVDLINDEGLSISSMLSNKVESTVISETKPTEDVTETFLNDLPSVMKYLDLNMNVTLKPVFVQDSSIWVWVLIKEVPEKLQVMEEKIKDLKKEENSLMAEEGDVAVAFSPKYSVWYRCYVKKRFKTSFLVRYIDYGEEEEVPKLYKISDELINVCSPLLHIDVGNLNQDVVETISLTEFSCIVTLLHGDSAEFTLKHNGVSYKLPVSSWYHGVSPITAEEKPAKPSSSLRVNNVQKSVENTKPISTQLCEPRHDEIKGSSGCKETSDFTKLVMLDRNISSASHTPVIVQWVNDWNSIFVQKASDIKDIEQLCSKLNTYCGSNPLKHTPDKGEIICAKYSADQMWYRSVVTDKLGPGKFRVHFVDYGNDEVVQLADIQPLNEMFCTPKFSLCVSLCSKPDIPVSTLLKQLVGKLFDVKVVDADASPMKVKFYYEEKEVEFSVKKQVSAKCPAPVLKKTSLKHLDISTFSGQVQVSYVDSSKFFHVRLVSSMNDYLEVKKEMKLLYSQLNSTEYVPAVDDLVSVQFKDEYYRGVIVKVNANTCIVEFVDDGLKEEITWSQIRPLRSCSSVPVLSIVVDLDEVDKESLTTTVLENLKAGPMRMEIVDSATSPMKVKFYMGSNCINEALQKPVDADTSSGSAHESYNIQAFDKKTLPLNTTVKVAFWHADGTRYFLHKFSDIEEVNNMSAILQAHCSESQPVCKMPSCSEVVCAKSSDEIWYRACVEELLPSETCRVVYIDYGNSEIVGKANLRALSKELAAHPIYGISVVIKNITEAVEFAKVYSVYTSGTIENIVVEFADVETPEKKHSQPCVPDHSTFLIDEFKKQSLPLNETLNVIFWFSKNGKYFLHNCSDVEPLNEMSSLLVEHCSKGEKFDHPVCLKEVLCAKSIDGGWYRACVVDILNNSSFKVRFIDYGNSEVVSRENIRSLPEVARSFPVFAIAVVAHNVPKSLEFGNLYSVQSSGTVDLPVIKFPGPIEPPPHSASPKGKPEDIIHYGSFKQLSLTLNVALDVIIWFQEKEFYFIHRASDGEAVAKMSTLLQKHCENSSPLQSMPTVGEVVCAMSSLDSVWYRACVQKIIDDKCIEVIFIDYGNTEIIERNNVRCSSKGLLSYPIYAIQVMAKNAPEEIGIGTVYSVWVSGTLQNPIIDFSGKSDSAQHHSPSLPSSRCDDLASMTRQSLPLNEDVDVLIWFQKKEKLFLQRMTDVESVAKMSEQMLQHCESCGSFQGEIMVGVVLCAKSSIDNAWYRASVQEAVGSDIYKVFFIDYGNCEEINKSNFCTLPKELSSLPVYGIEVTACDKPEPLEIGVPYSVHVSGSIQEPVIRFRCIESGNPTCGEQEVMQEAQQLAIDVPAVASTNESTPSTLLSDCSYVDFPLGRNSVMVYSVTSYEVLFCGPANEESIKANAELAASIDKYCSQIQPTYKPVALNEMVLAKDPEDNHWYRAAVIEIISDDEVAICFVDYGSVAVVNHESIRKITPEFMELPVQAHLCKLGGLSVTSEITEAVKEKIVKLIPLYTELDAVVSVSEEDGSYVLELTCIKKELRDMGLLL